MVIRTDRGPLQKPKRLGDTVVIEGHAARLHPPGDPLRYAHGDEYRDAAELRRVVDQLPGAPVTLAHPPTLIRDGGTARVVGRVDAAWIDGEHAAVRLTITDRDAARAVENGTKELSLGYATDVDAEMYQRDTKVDHLAIVDAARCGATCSLRTDSTHTTCSCSQPPPSSGTTRGFMHDFRSYALFARRRGDAALADWLEADAPGALPFSITDAKAKIAELGTRLDASSDGWNEWNARGCLLTTLMLAVRADERAHRVGVDVRETHGPDTGWKKTLAAGIRQSREGVK